MTDGHDLGHRPIAVEDPHHVAALDAGQIPTQVVLEIGTALGSVARGGVAASCPRGSTAASLTLIEALLGQLDMATIIARLVGLHTIQRER